jgi:hypothetical protein
MADARTPEPAVQPVRRELEDLLTRLRAAPEPVLSLYLDVHAGTDPNAPAQRADAALRELPLDRDGRERFERRIVETLRDVGEGTLAFFSAEDPADLEAYRLLRVAPPLPGGAREAVARWGAPWITPIELLLASEAPVVAVFTDERRARLFVQDLGEAEEASDYVRALDPSGWRRYSEHATGMPGTPARGGSGQDDFEDRKEAWTSRFVADVAGQAESAVAAREGARLVLLGETRRVNQLEGELSEPLKRALLATGPAPADPDLGPERWSGPLAEFVRSALHDEDEERLARLADGGVTGTGPTLWALQRGELAMVAVPADVDVDVVRCLNADWLAQDEDGLRDVCPDGPIARGPLKEHLLAAVKRGRARLRVLRGPDADRMVERVGPLAGLPRRS